MCEFSGNLRSIKDYNVFKRTINKIINEFAKYVFINDKDRIPLYIDNCYYCEFSNTGPVPIITPVLNQILIIKLGIKFFNYTPQIIFQFSHEYVHYIFYCLLGLNKPFADDIEENICTAISLAFIKKYENHTVFIEHLELVESFKESKYRDGASLASLHEFNIEKLFKVMLDRIEELKLGII